MPKLVVHGAQLRCNEGTNPSTLTVLPAIGSGSTDHPVATVQNQKPLVHIAAFGMCRTQTNPQVAAATAAAQGVLTPQPCVPVIAAPWSPGTSSVTFQGQKGLTDDSKCSCMWGGTITVTQAGTDLEVL